MFLLLAFLAQVALSPEQRALAYLAQEVPAWPKNNGCFSCHNNGDAARTLYKAHRLRFPIPRQALAATTGWLRHPDQWDSLPGNPVFSDKRLARIQFAAALAEAYESRLLRDPKPLLQAAQSLISIQHPDGYWPLDGGDTLGSPVTYGIPLATALASRALLAIPQSSQSLNPGNRSIAQSRRYLLSLPLASTLDAAAVLLGVGSQRPEAVDFLLRAQSPSGAWGPYPNSPAEPFDTAIALLALVSSSPRLSVSPSLLDLARQYLLQTQRPDGSWPETTRPSGTQSYAQRVSTSAWATQALLATSPRTPH